MEAIVAASCFSSPTKKALRLPPVLPALAMLLSWAFSEASTEKPTT